jgi:hypothetical protein
MKEIEMSADLKPAKINGELFWTKWMNNLNTKFNEANDKYECTIGNISDNDAAKLTALGIKVKNKDSMGNYIVCKSKYAFKPIGEDLKEIAVEDLGNGSKVVAVVSSYEHKMSKMHGKAPSLKNFMVTQVVTYVPDTEEAL